MKKFTAILVLLIFINLISYCQLLSNPFLNVEDIEIGLSNPDHLREILHDHEFIYEPGKGGNQNQPGSIRNPLVSNAEAIKTEYWRKGLNNKTVSSEYGSNIIRSLSINEWKTGHGPYPEAIRTITIMINEDSVYAKNVETFFQRIKDRYPIKTQRHIGNSELQREYSDPINVLANSSSKIEVRITSGQVGSSKDDVSDFFVVSFDLVR